MRRKQFAQHWLKDEATLDLIIEAADLQAGDRVLEIGPGTGALTRRLLPQVEALLAVEIDRDLCKLLVKKFRDAENFLLLQGDFLTLDRVPLLEPSPRFQQQNKVVANIPYNITGPILESLLGTIARPAATVYDAIVLLVQKEVAERLCADAGSKTFGALSVRVQYLAACNWVCLVPARCFHPKPKVDSAVVRLVPRPFPVVAANPQFLGTLVKVGFSSRRKMLRNNLKAIVDLQDLDKHFRELAIDPQCRAEDIDPERWVALSNALWEDRKDRENRKVKP